MLVPAQEWLEQRRVPPALGALLVLLAFLVVANLTIVAIVLPATEWVQLLPSRIAQIRANLAPLLDAFASLGHLLEQVSGVLGSQAGAEQAQVVVDIPNSAFELVTSSAPAAVVQTLFAILLV